MCLYIEAKTTFFYNLKEVYAQEKFGQEIITYLTFPSFGTAGRSFVVFSSMALF